MSQNSNFFSESSRQSHQRSNPQSYKPNLNDSSAEIRKWSQKSTGRKQDSSTFSNLKKPRSGRKRLHPIQSDSLSMEIESVLSVTKRRSPRISKTNSRAPYLNSPKMRIKSSAKLQKKLDERKLLSGVKLFPKRTENRQGVYLSNRKGNLKRAFCSLKKCCPVSPGCSENANSSVQSFQIPSHIIEGQKENNFMEINQPKKPELIRCQKKEFALTFGSRTPGFIEPSGEYNLEKIQRRKSNQDSNAFGKILMNVSKNGAEVAQNNLNFLKNGSSSEAHSLKSTNYQKINLRNERKSNRKLRLVSNNITVAKRDDISKMRPYRFTLKKSEEINRRLHKKLKLKSVLKQK